MVDGGKKEINGGNYVILAWHVEMKRKKKLYFFRAFLHSQCFILFCCLLLLLSFVRAKRGLSGKLFQAVKFPLMSVFAFFKVWVAFRCANDF